MQYFPGECMYYFPCTYYLVVYIDQPLVYLHVRCYLLNAYSFVWAGMGFALLVKRLFFFYLFKCRDTSWVWCFFFLPKTSASLTDSQYMEIEGSFKNLAVSSIDLKKEQVLAAINSSKSDMRALAPTFANLLRHKIVLFPLLCQFLTTLLTILTWERRKLCFQK